MDVINPLVLPGTCKKLVIFSCLNSIYIYSNLWDFPPGFMEVTDFKLLGYFCGIFTFHFYILRGYKNSIRQEILHYELL